MAPRWPKIAPRCPQDGRNKAPKWPQDCPNRAHDALLGPEKPPKAPSRSNKVPNYPQKYPKMAPRWPHHGPKRPQDRPKMAALRPKRLQIGPKMPLESLIQNIQKPLNTTGFSIVLLSKALSGTSPKALKNLSKWRPQNLEFAYIYIYIYIYRYIITYILFFLILPGH